MQSRMHDHANCVKAHGRLNHESNTGTGELLDTMRLLLQMYLAGMYVKCLIVCQV